MKSSKQQVNETATRRSPKTRRGCTITGKRETEYMMKTKEQKNKSTKVHKNTRTQEHEHMTHTAHRRKPGMYLPQVLLQHLGKGVDGIAAQ
jgi:hypothetical protein